MRGFSLVGFLLVILGAGAMARGAEPCRGGWHWPWDAHCHCPPCPCCPDDYCKKAPPVVCCQSWCGVNDYCKKTPPIVCCPTWCGVNDYCPKPCPYVAPCPPCWYRCKPTGCPCPGP